ncbi:MAG TPA: peroxiredoxin [Dehalococcoidia bacterium]|nr:peroxiredoxin [Dehalococcoidia bacterium]
MGDTTRTLKVGDAAPDFELRGTGGTKFKLSEAKGQKNVVLNFFPAAFSGVCSMQMPRIQSELSLFGEDTAVFGVSVDNTWSLEAFAKQTGAQFPLLADFYPHGGVAEAYGVLLPNGVAERAVIGIDKQGVVRYIDVHAILEVPELGGCALALKG